MSATTSTDLQQSIAATNAEFVSALSRGDAAGMAATYSTYGQLLPPNSPPIVGRPGIQAFWQAVLDAGVRAAQLETVELAGQGEVVYEVGTYVLRGEGGQEIDHGKFIVIWTQENGQWKWHRDLYNSSQAA